MDLSTKISIYNLTSFEFRLISSNVIWGYWDTPPPGILSPKVYNQPAIPVSFLLRDTSGAAAGSEGSVIYSFGSNVVEMKFCDSYGVRGNYASINFVGKGKEYQMYEMSYHFLAKAGSGDWQQDVCPLSGHPLEIAFYINAVFPVRLDDKTFKRLKKTAPKISQDTFLVIANAVPTYNCLAWAMGITYAWVNIPTDINNLTDLLASAGEITHTGARGVKWKSTFNYVPVQKGGADAFIDVLSLPSGVPEHATRFYRDAYFKTGNWTSKLGPDFLACHKRHALDDSTYGSITHSFKRRKVADKTISLKRGKVVDKLGVGDKRVEFKDFVQVHKAKHFSVMLKPLDEAKLSVLHDYVENLSEGLKQDFQKKYAVWTGNCAQSFSSNTYQYTLIDGFQQLEDMGDSILHLVVKEMIEERNFLLLMLYEKIQKDPKLHVDYDYPLEAEQSRARRAVHLYLKKL